MLQSLRLALHTNASSSGSALFEHNGTIVSATVFGPHENARAAGDFVSTGSLEMRVQFAPFASRARASLAPAVAAEEERQLEAALLTAITPSVLLERFPKAVVAVHILVLSLAGGGELAASITAASAALVDAGVELAGVVTAARVCAMPPDAPCAPDAVPLPLAICTSPSPSDAARASGCLTLAYMPALQLVTLAAHAGAVEGDDALRLCTAAMIACNELAQSMRPALEASAPCVAQK